MKKNKLNRRSPQENKGVALIFALGILALVALIGSTFISVALSDRLSSRAVCDATVANYLAETGATNAMVLVSLYGSGGTCSFSDSRDDLPSAIEAGNPGLGWIDVFGDNPNIPIGRYAYGVRADARLTPDACVKDGTTEGATEDRPGVEVSEINLKYVKKSAPDVANYGDCLGFTDKRWADYNALRTRVTSLTEDEVTSWFVVPGKEDKEAFWLDVNGDGVLQEDTELFHRFNVALADTAKQKTKWGINDNDIGNSWDGLPAVWSDITNAKERIPWITQRSNNAFVITGSNNPQNSRQVLMANLIDYLDTDSNAHCTNWYCGLEKIPYTNEIRFKFSVTTSSLDPEGDGTYAHTVRLALDSFDLEFVNMYDEEVTFDIATNNCQFTYQPQTGSTVKGNRVCDIPGPSGNSITVPARSYKVVTIPCSFTNEWTESNTDTTCSIARIEFGKIEMVQRKGGRVIGKAKMLTPKDLNNSDAHRICAGAPFENGDTVYMSAEINDPRCQFIDGKANVPGRWTIVSGKNTEVGSIGGRNAHCRPNVGGVWGTVDQEDPNAEPWEISSAFIRNGPMKSPWEIGMVHRGEPWQTFNISKYNTTVDQGVNAKGAPAYGGGKGIGPYANGDANILDQIKMTENSKTYGKVSINTQTKEVLHALFGDIKLGCDIDKDNTYSPTNGGTVISIGDIDNYRTVLSNKNKVYKTRAEAMGELGLPGNDAQKEELIGKVVNLLKADISSDSTTIYVIGQATRGTGKSLQVLGEQIIKLTLSKDTAGNWQITRKAYEE